MNHKTIKSVRKQLLYLHDKFKLIEQSIKIIIQALFQLKFSTKINNPTLSQGL